jgi:Predicted membrane protein
MGTMGLGIIGWIVVGGLAGWIASAIMKAKTGLLANIGLGIVGSVVLNFILGAVGIYTSGGFVPQLIVGAAGAALLIWIARKLR